MANVTEMTDWADLPEILTIDEVAAYLRYSRKTIRRMIDDGRLAGVMLAFWLRYNGPDTSLSFEIMMDVLLIVVIGGYLVWAYNGLVSNKNLVAEGWTTPDQLAIRGGSAGGLLMGAVTNMRPELFRVVVAEVPFVDALNTILDPSLPLTVIEWEEWGNPLTDPEVYAAMRAYTPYENVRPARYPAVLATSSLHDTRVYVTEPAKWVTRLREVATNDLEQRPVLMRTSSRVKSR